MKDREKKEGTLHGGRLTRTTSGARTEGGILFLSARELVVKTKQIFILALRGDGGEEEGVINNPRSPP